MAYVVARKGGRFEIRESRSTSRGPRARTLVSFRALDDDVIARARARARGRLDEAKIRARAAELAVPQRVDGAAATARRLIAELRRGEAVPPRLAAELRALLPEPRGEMPDTLDDVMEWVGVDDVQRGRAARELHAFASAFPPTTRAEKPLDFPRLRTR
jgi:hypothetical protein